MVEAYPLQWPPGWPRTEYPKRSRFGTKNEQGCGLYDISMDKARTNLQYELRLLKATDVVISTNLKQRKDGTGPLASQRNPDDKGVAVYFTLNGKQQCFPNDKWDRVEDNIYAIAKTIEAMRGIERWGSQEMVTATFKGFEQLPNDIHERVIVSAVTDYFQGVEDLEEAKERFRNLVKVYHPEVGGDQATFIEINSQFEELKKRLRAKEE